MRTRGWSVGVIAVVASCLSTAQYEQAHNQRVNEIAERYATQRANTADQWNQLLRQVDDMKQFLVAVKPDSSYSPVERVEDRNGLPEFRVECANEAAQAKAAEPELATRLAEVVKLCWDKYYELYGPALRGRYFKADFSWVKQQLTSATDLESLLAYSHNAAVIAEMDAQRASIIAARERALANLEADQTEEVQLSAQQRDSEVAAARQRHAHNMAIVAAALQGAAQGMSQPSRPVATQYGTATPAQNTCASDFNCGIGYTCVKNLYAGTGYCAVAVNSSGVQTFQAPRLDSVLPNMNVNASCSRYGCPGGFRCDYKSGACLR